MTKSVRQIRKAENVQAVPASLVYAFGLDMGLVARWALSQSMPLVYEIGDIQNPLPHGTILTRVSARLEKTVLQRCCALVVTSPGFVSDYFHILDPQVDRKVFVIENKMAREIAAEVPRPAAPKQPTYPIKIGYVGLFKYRECIVRLIDAVAARQGAFELHFYGDGPLKEEIVARVAQCKNVFFHGPFVSTQDLQSIYERIDASYVVYDNHDPNVRMALPNKLYDGPYFGVPLIVAEGTLLAKRTIELGIGLVVDPRCEGFAEGLLNTITPELLTGVSAAALKVDPSFMVEDYGDIVPWLNQLGG